LKIQPQMDTNKHKYGVDANYANGIINSRLVFVFRFVLIGVYSWFSK
jgi:hypothetical protein